MVIRKTIIYQQNNRKLSHQCQKPYNLGLPPKHPIKVLLDNNKKNWIIIKRIFFQNRHKKWNESNVKKSPEKKIEFVTELDKFLITLRLFKSGFHAENTTIKGMKKEDLKIR